jgi:hypothetical protein
MDQRVPVAGEESYQELRDLLLSMLKVNWTSQTQVELENFADVNVDDGEVDEH